MTSPSFYIQACSNGRLHDAREASISPLNRGFLYGDAIYEVWRTYHGVVFAWTEHWRRLEQSAAALHLTLPFNTDCALREIKRTIAAYRSVVAGSDDYYIRLQVTRGGGAIGLDTALAEQSDYVLLVQPNRPYSTEKFREGLKLSLATSLRRNPVDSLNPAWKTGNYLNNILCLREARTRGADEVVIMNLGGEIAEAAVSNIAFVRDGEVVTPPKTAGILGGITRELLLAKIAKHAGIIAREATLRPEELGKMDECFLLSTTKDITPVSSIDAHRFRVGDHTVAARLKTAFADFARDYAMQHPEWHIA